MTPMQTPRLLVALAAALWIAAPGRPAATELQGRLEFRPAGSFAPGPAPFGQRGGLVITLVNATTGTLIARTTSDPSGTYRFHDVGAGSYRILVGYPTVLRAHIVAVEDGIVQQLAPIVLGPLPP